MQPKGSFTTLSRSGAVDLGHLDNNPCMAVTQDIDMLFHKRVAVTCHAAPSLMLFTSASWLDEGLACPLPLALCPFAKPDTICEAQEVM